MRNNGQAKDSTFVVVGAFLFLVGLIYWTLTTSPVIYFEAYLPWLKGQSTAYSLVAPSIYKEEAVMLDKIDAHLATVVKKDRSYKTISFEAAKNKINEYSSATRITSSIIAVIVLSYFTFLLIKRQIKWKNTIMNRNENIAVQTGAGVNGVIMVLQRFCGKDVPGLASVIAEIEKNPSPRNLHSIFALIRLKKNIPNNLAGRQFPAFSEERLALLEVGKEKEFERATLPSK